MKLLNLTKYYKDTFLHQSIQDFKDDDVFTQFDYQQFPRCKLKEKNIEYDFSKIKDKGILCNQQHVKIHTKARKIALAGCSLMCANKDKIKIIYADNHYEYKFIKFDDYTCNLNQSIKWMFGKQKKDYQGFSPILYESYNEQEEVFNFIYYYVISLDMAKDIEEIVLPKNELILLFAITIL